MDFKQRGKAFSVAEKTFISQMRKSTQEAEHMKLQFDLNRDNKQKFNKFLTDRRIERVNLQKEEAVQRKWSLYQTKLQDLGAGGKYEEKLDEEGVPTNAPIDYQFETGMNDTKIKRQNIAIPAAKQRLYVTKHIADYQPLPVMHKTGDKLQRGINEAPKRVFPEKATNFNHKREVATELTAEELASI